MHFGMAEVLTKGSMPNHRRGSQYFSLPIHKASLLQPRELDHTNTNHTDSSESKIRNMSGVFASEAAFFFVGTFLNLREVTQTRITYNLVTNRRICFFYALWRPPGVFSKDITSA